MSELIKTEAIVLKKIDFGDTSRIAQFFTEDFGKISAILKGARSPKSRIGGIIDTFNHLQIVFYKKESREVQLVSQVDLISHFHTIKENLEKFKYASASLELLKNLTVENEEHKKLFRGTVKIFNMMNLGESDPALLFVKYFVFFLKEIGYDFPTERCSVCGNQVDPAGQVSYNYETGLLCSECKQDRITSFDFSLELFNFLLCLKHKKNDISYNKDQVNKIINILEKHLMYNVHEFKGLKSLHSF